LLEFPLFKILKKALNSEKSIFKLFYLFSTQFLIWAPILKIALKGRVKSLDANYFELRTLLKILKSGNPRKIH